jgi:pimeloyl-ACP methyl ester carboxylesterase
VKVVLISASVILVLVIVAMAIIYYVSQNRLMELNEATRADLPGDFVELPDGVISYYLRGPKTGEQVVLVHGFSTPKFVWDLTTGPLTEAGFKVLAYDHYGRGFSDRPDITYDADLYARELLNLLDALNITEPVTLVGYSMGGGNVIGFTSRYPERVKKLILIAPVGFMPEPSGLSSLIALPGLGEFLMSSVYLPSLLKQIENDEKSGSGTPHMSENFARQLAYKGYSNALLSTLRNYPMADLAEDYRLVGATGIPVFAIWGTADTVVPFSGAEKARRAIPGLEIYPVEGAEHSVTYAQAEIVNGKLIEFLGQ